VKYIISISRNALGGFPGTARQGEKAKTQIFFYHPDVLQGKMICVKV